MEALARLRARSKSGYSAKFQLVLLSMRIEIAGGEEIGFGVSSIGLDSTFKYWRATRAPVLGLILVCTI